MGSSYLSSVSDLIMSTAWNQWNGGGALVADIGGCIAHAANSSMAAYQTLTYPVATSMESQLEIYNVFFNQDSSSLAVCHEEGYYLYNVSSIEGTDFKPVISKSSPKKTILLERLFQSSLITLVSKEQSRMLEVYHFGRDHRICSTTFTSAIKSVKMNRKRVVVCLEETIHIYDIANMTSLHTIGETPLNKDGLMELSSLDNPSYLAYPGSADHGIVNVYDAYNLRAASTIAAHDSPLAALRFSPDGTKLATASTRGTVIRIYSIEKGERIYEFSRGVMRSVQISSLAFSSDGRFLCSSSNTETVHVFSLAKAEEERVASQAQSAEAESDQSIASWVSYLGKQATNYLPARMGEYITRAGSFAIARLPFHGLKTSIAMQKVGKVDYLLVASTNGYLFCYSLPVEPGECTLAKQFKIGPNSEDEERLSEGPIYPNVSELADDVSRLSFDRMPGGRGSGDSTSLSGLPLSSSPVTGASPLGRQPRRKTLSTSSASAVPIVALPTKTSSPSQGRPASGNSSSDNNSETGSLHSTEGAAAAAPVPAPTVPEESEFPNTSGHLDADYPPLLGD